MKNHMSPHTVARAGTGANASAAETHPAYLIHTRVRSWNQLCALTKPWTCLVMARGLRSWTIHTHGASSTKISCIAARALRNSSSLLAPSILRSNASNSGLRQCPQFEHLGVALSPENQRTTIGTSDETRLMFMASELTACGAVGSDRKATSMVPHSTTSKLMSKPHCFIDCCRNSFIGSGSIWPDPEVEIMILPLTVLPVPWPASARSFFAMAGSNL